MKNLFIGVGLLVIIGIGVFVYSLRSSETTVVVNENVTPNATPEPQPLPPAPEPTPEPEDKTQTVIGSSVKENDIVAYHFGEGEKEILFIGGIHGGYGWNTSLVAFELMDYLKANPTAIPGGVKVTVIPVLNPDGLSVVTGSTGRFSVADAPTAIDAIIPGRFNGNTVDLNRNFDCDWQTSGIWQNKTVSGGSKVFSEPESQAVRDYVQTHTPTAVIVWYSAAGGVYASNCHNGVLPETKTLTSLYAKASGYPAHESFDYYEVTGDMVNWFAKNNIPAISVLLTNHTDTEWDKNKKGIEAVLNSYAE